MGSLRATLFSAESRMTALIFIRTFAKPILALLFCLSLYFAFIYYNHLQQKVGQLENELQQKQDRLNTQNQNIINIKSQLNLQAQAIADLQKIQDELKQHSEQRQITLKEILNNDQQTKTWASQPVPDAIRSMFNNTSSPKIGSDLSHTYSLPETKLKYSNQ